MFHKFCCVPVSSIPFLINLGEHPRFGAMDVCPFIPVRNATMKDCVDCANRLAEKLASELCVPGMLAFGRLNYK